VIAERTGDRHEQRQRWKHRRPIVATMPLCDGMRAPGRTAQAQIDAIVCSPSSRIARLASRTAALER
jgi:hypothetical protein